MEIKRTWAMPNKNTFTIPPIEEIVKKYTKGKSIDPFAGPNKLALITNDIDDRYHTDYNMDAIDFLKMFDNENVDTVLFDPPYTPRQVAEVYTRLRLTVDMETTQASFWSNMKKEIGRITKMYGIVISTGWNSGGVGKKYGFELLEVLMVPHGGQHNDTIVTVERKVRKQYKSDDSLIS